MAKVEEAYLDKLLRDLNEYVKNTPTRSMIKPSHLLPSQDVLAWILRFLMFSGILL